MSHEVTEKSEKGDFDNDIQKLLDEDTPDEQSDDEQKLISDLVS